MRAFARAAAPAAFDFVTLFRSNRHRQPQTILNTIWRLMERRLTPQAKQYLT
jgi:hypothetical protein